MTNIFIRPYGASTSALHLSRGLQGKRIKKQGSRYRYRPGHIVINWGNTIPFEGRVSYNQPVAVSRAVNKIKTFQILKREGVPTLEWTYDVEEARRWQDEGYAVYARETATGHAGEGINVYLPGEPPPSGYTFYTKRFKTKREFRAHVINGEVVQVQEKKRRRDADNVDEYVRSHNNQWVFCIHNLDPIPETINSTAIRAVNALGLDFGAVDLAIDFLGNVCVFEVNTAPGIEGSTIGIYVNKFKELINYYGTL